MFKKLSLSVFIISPMLVSAQATNKDLQLNTITTAMPFLSITPDSRSGAMGDAGTAVSANSNSIYWNTAMLNFAKKDAEISISYTPWLRQLTNDIHLSYLSGYKKLGDRQAITAALRYFSLGEITYTDNLGNVTRNDTPSEFEITGGYAFKLSDRLSVGLNGKFAYSNLTGGMTTASGAQSKAGIAGATDLSFIYYNEDVRMGGRNGILGLGATINNVGNKIAYSALQQRDFLPMNLKLGFSYMTEFDKYNTLTWAVDIQKLLVPTPPNIEAGTGVILSGKNNNVGVISGMLQSFYDAPGVLVKDPNGTIESNSGTYSVEKGSRFKEELREINIATGLEYWYNEMFAMRGGLFYEHYTKGSRQYVNAGIGLKYNIIGIDISYLAALKKNNPLANTLRFTLRFDIGSKSSTKSATPE